MLEMPFFATSQNLALEESKGRKQFLTLLTFGCLSHSCVSTKLYRQVQLQWEICTLILADGVNSRMGAEI